MTTNTLTSQRIPLCLTVCEPAVLALIINLGCSNPSCSPTAILRNQRGALCVALQDVAHATKVRLVAFPQPGLPIGVIVRIRVRVISRLELGSQRVAIPVLVCPPCSASAPPSPAQYWL